MPCSYRSLFILFQVQSFTQRSSALSGLEETSQDNSSCLNTAENTTQDHHGQPDPKEPEITKKDRNITQALQQKRVQDEDSKRHSRVRDVTIKLKKLPEDFTGGGRSKLGSRLTAKGAPPPGISSKLKIVKNKNINGRIIIVMSKHAGGSQAANTRNTEAGVEVEQLLQRELTGNALDTDWYSENHTPDNGCMKDSHDEAKPTTHGSLHSAVNHSITNKRKESGGSAPHPPDQPSHLMVESSLALKPSEPDLLLHSDRRSGHKRHGSQPEPEQEGQTKRFLSFQIIRGPNSGTPHLNGHQLEFSGHQQEPTDSRFSGSGEQSDSITHRQITSTCKTPETEEEPRPEQPNEELESEPSPSSSPFHGNILITDITSHSLTVTFKEYVAF